MSEQKKVRKAAEPAAWNATRLRIAMAFVLLACACSSAPAAPESFGPQPDGNGTVEVRLVFNPAVYPDRYGGVWPQFAVWLEADAGAEVHTAYVTRGAALNRFWGAGDRPESLPVWEAAHLREQAASPSATVDAVTSATPVDREDFAIRWNVPTGLRDKALQVRVEANVSFDFNDIYVEGGAAEGQVDAGVNGQPSLVWTRTLPDRLAGGAPASPELAGRGSLDGKDGALQPDLDHITTAKDLFRSIEIRWLP